MTEKVQVTISIPKHLKRKVDRFQEDMRLKNRSHTVRVILNGFFEEGYNLAALERNIKNVEGTADNLDETLQDMIDEVTTTEDEVVNVKEDIQQLSEQLDEFESSFSEIIHYAEQDKETEQGIEQEDEEEIFEPGSDEARIADMAESMDMTLDELEDDFPEFQEGGQTREAFLNVKEELNEA